jgi:hypothetical protein
MIPDGTFFFATCDSRSHRRKNRQKRRLDPFTANAEFRRQKFAVLISKSNFHDSQFSRFQQLSTSIGRFSTTSAAIRYPLSREKNTVGVELRHMQPAEAKPPQMPRRID